MWSSVLFHVFIFAAALAIGDFVSVKTKGVVTTVLTASIIYLAGYFLGLIPRDSLGQTGLLTIIGNFGLLLIVTNLGTMIDLGQLLAEWRTVAICAGSLLVLGILFIVVGGPIFGMDYALTAYPPIAGGGVATTMVSEAAVEAGVPELGSFAWLLATLQMFVGIPVASVVLRFYCFDAAKTAEFKSGQTKREKIEQKQRSFRIIPEVPEKYNSANTILAKLLLVTMIAYAVSNATGIPVAIMCLVLGVLCCEIGLLDKSALQASGTMNFLMFCLLASAPSSFGTLSMDGLTGMIPAVIAFLALGCAALAVGGILLGKVFRMDARLAAAVSLTALFGFPFNLMITEDIIRAMELTEEEKARLRDMVLPKMIVAGFATVTVASVAIAGIVIPFIF